jgi:shikimate dehydrogenase
MQSKIYGLVGKSLTHSFSKDYFTSKFDKLNISASYRNFEIDTIQQIKDVLKTPNLAGLNVTIPYKESIIPFLDEIDDVAKQIGAVNTIQIINGKTIGFNTDVYGFKQMIKPFFESHHHRAIILGTGGASKAVDYVLRELGCEPIFISRNPNENNQFGYNDVNEIMVQVCPIIVNTTPVGTYPNVNEMPTIPTEFLTDKNLVIDLIYNPKETLLLKKAKEKNAWTLNGLTMLHQQAEKAWKIWNE